MPLMVRVTFTGICSILREYDRVLLPNAARVAKTCGGTPLPVHRAYIRYRLNDDNLGTHPDKFDHPTKPTEGAIFLHGDEIILKGTPTLTSTAPGPIKHVAPMGEIFPGLQLSAAILQAPAALSHAAVAAYFRLNGGSFAAPNPSATRRWHFFPQKANPVHGPLAQAVTYNVTLAEANCVIAVQPFGARTAVDILDLRASTGVVDILIGNTIEADIFPTNTTDEPPLGPDPHFEIYYRFAASLPPCPLPIPYYEGDSTKPRHVHTGGGSHVHAHGGTQQSMAAALATAAKVTANASGFLAIGGTNCPPNQWP